VLPSRYPTLSASGTELRFGAIGAAHPLAHLRIAASVTGRVARLTAGLPGSALAGRDFHPLGCASGFRNAIASFFLPDQRCLVARGDVIVAEHPSGEKRSAIWTASPRNKGQHLASDVVRVVAHNEASVLECKVAARGLNVLPLAKLLLASHQVTMSSSFPLASP